MARVPEPGSITLLAMGAVGLLGYAWRNTPDAYYDRGIAYRHKGDHAKAEADFAKARELLLRRK